MKRIFLLTGRPGVGKTTALANIIQILRVSGIAVGGVMSREKRVAGVRRGFEFLDLLSNRTGTLADVAGEGPRLGKYRVNLHDLASVGVAALESSLKRADVTAIDEIGPMELLSKEFLQAIYHAIDSGRPIIGTIHSRLRHRLIEEVRSRPEVQILEVTYSNRDQIPGKVAERILRTLGRRP